MVLNEGIKTPQIKISPSTKHYLSNFILKAMRCFHEGRNIDTTLKELLINSNFLFEKCLFKQSTRLLRQAKELAKRFDKHSVLLEILNLEALIQLEYGTKKTHQAMASIHNEAKEVLLREQQDKPMIFLQQQMLLMARTHYHIQKEQQNDYDAQLQEFLAAAQSSGRFDPEYYTLYALALYHNCRGEYEQCADAYEKLLVLWEKWHDRLEEESIEYKKIISNYLVICHRLERFDRYPMLLEIIRSIPCRNAEEEAEQFQNLQLMELLFLMNTDGYSKLDKLSEEIKEGLHRFRNRINKARELLFYHNMAIAYFLKHDWKSSLEWLGKIINDKKSEHRLDIQNFARIFRLVLWYETGKHDLLEYELINVERFLRSRKSWTGFESSVIKLINRFLIKGAKDQYLLSQLHEKMQFLITNKKTGTSEIYLWTRSHMENKTMRELLLIENS
jgi:tetratricopeptide (TPR) repeat protein